MNGDQALAERGAFKVSSLTLEEALLELCRYGHPRLSNMQGGWYAKIEVFVTGEGVGFDVASDFKQPTPTAAVNQCFERLQAALQKIRETT